MKQRERNYGSLPILSAKISDRITSSRKKSLYDTGSSKNEYVLEESSRRSTIKIPKNAIDGRSPDEETAVTATLYLHTQAF